MELEDTRRSARDALDADRAIARSESYYASAYNAPGDARVGSAPPWGLRGYVPPARLRVAGFAYANAEDSERGVAREWGVMRVIDEREVVYDGEEDGAERAMDVPTGEREATTRTRAGAMSSRPSWTAIQYLNPLNHGACAT